MNNSTTFLCNVDGGYNCDADEVLGSPRATEFTSAQELASRGIAGLYYIGTPATEEAIS